MALKSGFLFKSLTLWQLRGANTQIGKLYFFNDSFTFSEISAFII